MAGLVVDEEVAVVEEASLVSVEMVEAVALLLKMMIGEEVVVEEVVRAAVAIVVWVAQVRLNRLEPS